MAYAIIGGGIGGLTTALAFDKLGISYKLFERAKTIEAVGAGIWLSPNALQVLEWIHPELLKKVMDAGNELDRILLADHRLNALSDSDQTFVKNRFGYSTIAIHRGQLQQILYEFANKHCVVLGKEFQEYTSAKDSLTDITFTDGSRHSSEYIIGADGINSKIRQQLFPDSKIRYSGQTCWRGISRFHLDDTLARTGFTLWGKQLQFGASKISNGNVYWFAVKLSPPNLKDETDDLKQELITMFEGFHTVVSELITHTPEDQIIRSDINDLELLNTWYTDHVCLIGDAAHSMTPDLGQGGAQAIEDAYYLANAIHKSETDAFKRFHEARRDKVRTLVKLSRRTSKIAVLKYGEGFRNFLMKHLPEKYMQKQLLDTYSL